MADGYGGIVAGSWRCHTAAWISAQTDTSVTIRVEARFQAVNGWRFNINGVSGTVRCDGQSASGTGSANIGTNGEAVIVRRDFTVPKRDNARSISCSASVTQSAFNAGSSSASCSVTMPGVAYLRPNPPKNVTYTRESDTAAKATWQGNWDNAARKPWKNVQVWQRTATGNGSWGAWTRKATLNWDATSYRFTGLSANQRWQFGVFAVNQAGESTHMDSVVIHSTPAAPKSVKATKTGANTVRVDVDCSNSAAYMVRIDRVVDGTRTHLQWVTPTNGKVSWTDNTAPSGTISYDVLVSRPIYGNDTTKGELISAWVRSNTVSTLQPPKPPTITGPTGVHPIGSTVTVTWVPNHPDGTDQSAAQLKVTKPIGGGDETIDVTGNTTSCSVSCPTPGEYSVQVRTKGLHADWGAWSTPHTWRCANPPSVTITSLGNDGIITDLPIVIAWTASDWDGLSEQTVSLSDDGRIVWQRTLSGTPRSVTVPANQLLPANGSTLLARVTVRSGSTLTATATTSAIVQYTPPATPTGTLTTTDTYGMMIQALAGVSDADTPDTASLSVERIDPDGTVHLVADGLDSGEYAIDRLPPLRRDCEYRITAHADSGAIASANVPGRVESDRVVLNFGADASECLPIGGAWKLSEKPVLDTVEYHFADDTGLPVSYGSGELDNAISVSSSYVWDDDGDLYRTIRRLARTHSRGWIRTPDGAVMHARISLTQSLSADGLSVNVGVDADELRWEEPQHG